MTKIEKRLYALYQRLQASDTLSSEYQVAKKLFDELCLKHGINESIFSEVRKEATPETVTWNSKLTFSKLPQWFKIYVWVVSEALECKAIVGNGTALLIGEQLVECQAKLTHGLERMKITFDLLKVFTKDLHQASYNLGFAFGYRAAIEEKLAKDINDTATETALVAISTLLTTANKYMVKLVEDSTGNTPEESVEIPKIKDQNSFKLGWLNGFQAFKLLLTGKSDTVN